MFATPLLLAVFSTSAKADDQFEFPSALWYQQFPATKWNQGHTRLPDFVGRDKAFKEYRTRIRRGMIAGPTFAGHYTVITIGCGGGCAVYYIGDNLTGQVFDFPKEIVSLEEKYNMLQLLYRFNSRLILAQGVVDHNPDCKYQAFLWNDNATVTPLGNKRCLSGCRLLMNPGLIFASTLLLLATPAPKLLNL